MYYTNRNATENNIFYKSGDPIQYLVRREREHRHNIQIPGELYLSRDYTRRSFTQDIEEKKLIPVTLNMLLSTDRPIHPATLKLLLMDLAQ